MSGVEAAKRAADLLTEQSDFENLAILHFPERYESGWFYLTEKVRPYLKSLFLTERDTLF